MRYPAPGSPGLARLTRDTVRKTEVRLDSDWGLDHGAWSVPTNEHFLPLLYILALQDQDESVEFFAGKVTLGSISMRSLKIG